MSNNINVVSSTTTSYINEVIKNVVAIQQPSNIVNISTGTSGGSVSGDYVLNNDPRLSDSRSPLAHKNNHSIGGSDPLVPSDIGAQPAGNYILDSDNRLTNSRNPLSHADSHKIGGSDTILPSDIGAQPVGNYVLDSDNRLTNSRNPLSHADSHKIGGSDTILPSDIGAQPAGNYVLDSDSRLTNNRNPNPHSRSTINDLSGLIIQGSGINVAYDSINYQYTLSSSGGGVSVNPKTITKAWINFNGTGTISIRDSFNIDSIVDNGSGAYTINFSTPMANTNYCFVGWSRDWNTDNTIINGISARSNTLKTVSSLSIINTNIINGVNYDSPEINIVVFGE